jgi:16S rRNA (adenine1518-N6/adenine1519-N6)-dimethyltransferase
LKRRAAEKLNCDEELFKRVVKTAFNQRRKTMRNSLKEIVSDKALLVKDIFNRRPEELSVAAFEDLTNLVSCQG